MKYRLMLLAAAILTAGCQTTKEQSPSPLAGYGIEGQVHVELSDRLKDLGLTFTVAKIDPAGPYNNYRRIILYVIAEQALDKVTTLAKAYDIRGREIGRATLELTLDAGEAQYVKYAFPVEMDMQTVAKYVIDIKP
ncbi:MAG: hypothetical protein JW709_00885 [Sedimentisphaerales bacterium]|nr:hypothetical protein [Sedimentisphaerales bacterium]